MKMLVRTGFQAQETVGSGPDIKTYKKKEN